MKAPSRKRLPETAGATLVEFALTAPLFFVLVFGGIQVGLALWTQFGLQYGSEAAARCASVNASTCGTADQVSGYAASHALGLSLPSTVFSAAASSCGNEVTAAYNYAFYLPFFGAPTLTLTARSCFPA